MKISSKTKYALLTVMDLAMYRNTGIIKVADIAKRQDIPQKFLEQILLLLKGAGIVTSKRGSKGGYALTRPASEITLASIVRLTEASLLVSNEPEGSESNCPFREVWDEIDAYIQHRLETVKIQNICELREETSWVPEYSI